MSIGINRKGIKEIIEEKLNENSDILMGVDDPEINELINILVDAIAEAFEDNNDEIERNLS